eukprot:3692367-Prymnesium_polylepis.1
MAGLVAADASVAAGAATTGATASAAAAVGALEEGVVAGSAALAKGWKRDERAVARTGGGNGSPSFTLPLWRVAYSSRRPRNGCLTEKGSGSPNSSSDNNSREIESKTDTSATSLSNAAVWMSSRSSMG